MAIDVCVLRIIEKLFVVATCFDRGDTNIWKKVAVNEQRFLESRILDFKWQMHQCYINSGM